MKSVLSVLAFIVFTKKNLTGIIRVEMN